MGILSDSHLHETVVTSNLPAYQNFKQHLANIFADVDHIIHAGDVNCEEFLDDLRKIAPVSVVQGNVDAMHGMTKWPRVLRLNFEGVSIGVAHEFEKIGFFQPDEIKVFIYGHTHIPDIHTDERGILVVNPGSIRKPRARPTSRFFETPDSPRPTVAFLTIEKGLFSALIKPL